MSIRTSAKKVAIAAVMVAPLVLAACGSDDGSEEATTTTTTSSTTSSSTTTTEEVTEETTEETTEEVTEETTEQVAPEPSTEAPVEPAPEPPAEAAPAPVIPTQDHAPVDQGQAASPQDAQAIESLVRGAVAPTTVRSMFEYIPKNTCNRVIEAAGGQAAMDFSMFPDVPLNQFPGVSAGTVDSISDVMVQGDTASAWVVASGNGQTDSGTQRFLREDGRWKFCD